VAGPVPDQRESGTSFAGGGVQARALIPAAWTRVKVPGRPRQGTPAPKSIASPPASGPVSPPSTPFLPGGETLRLCRLRYAGCANDWGFAIYRASHGDYQDNYLPTGLPGGTAKAALDTACGLYLADPTAWA
jgi:hypothetical protein